MYSSFFSLSPFSMSYLFSPLLSLCLPFLCDMTSVSPPHQMRSFLVANAPPLQAVAAGTGGIASPQMLQMNCQPWPNAASGTAENACGLWTDSCFRSFLKLTQLHHCYLRNITLLFFLKFLMLNICFISYLFTFFYSLSY